MRILIFSIVSILTACAHTYAGAENKNAATKFSEKDLYEYMVSFAQKKRSKNENDFENFQKASTLLASHKSNESTMYLAKLQTFYFGSAPDNYLTHLVLRIGKPTLPYLKKEVHAGATCNTEKYRCNSRIESTIESIMSNYKPLKDKDEAGDPFRYYERKEFPKVFQEIFRPK